MALLQPTKAIYHHPLDSKTETTIPQDWTGTVSFSAAKVSSGLIGSSDTSSPLTTGAEAEFLSVSIGDGSRSVAEVGINDTQFVVIYRDSTDGFNGNAKVGTVSGTSIAYGAEVEFRPAGAVNDLAIAKLDSTHVVVCYRDGGDGENGTAKIGVVTGTSISFGAEEEFRVGVPDAISVAALTTTKFVVVYRDNSDALHGTAKVGTVSGGTTIAFGAESEFRAAAVGGTVTNVDVTSISATQVVVVYQDDTDADHGTAKVGTVSGTDIVFGVESEFLTANAGNGNTMSVTTLDSTHIVVAYRNQDDSFRGKARVGTVTGTTISFGTEAEFNGAIGGTNDIGTSACAISSTQFILAYRDSTDSQHGNAKVGTVSGTSITFGVETTWNSGVTGVTQISLAKITSSLVTVVYQDDNDGKHGTAQTLSFLIAATLTGTGASYPTTVGSSKLAYTGWLKNPSA